MMRSLPTSPARQAFTLIEVMIAVSLLFIALFGILQLTSQNLQVARQLQQVQVDIGSLASELTLTNRLEEGTVTGNFGDTYPGFRWVRTTTLVSSNGLFQVDFTVYGSIGDKPREQTLSAWYYKPESGMRLSGGRR